MTQRVMIIHLGDTLLRRSCDLPGSAPRCAELQISNLKLSATRAEPDQLKYASLFGLAPQGVCLAGDVATAAGDAFTSPFHQRPARKRA